MRTNLSVDNGPEPVLGQYENDDRVRERRMVTMSRAALLLSVSGIALLGAEFALFSGAAIWAVHVRVVNAISNVVCSLLLVCLVLGLGLGIAGRRTIMGKMAIALAAAPVAVMCLYCALVALISYLAGLTAQR